MDYQSLVRKYPRFDYNGYQIKLTSAELKITYSFSIEGLSDFRPRWIIPLNGKLINSDENAINNLVFHLGLVELVSYWKVTCSPHVYIHAGSLSDAQIDWWKKLYFYGLGEFFYINNIDANIDEFMTLYAVEDASKLQSFPTVPAYLDGNLIPVGGGKDSIVTLDLLKPCMKKNMCYMMNKTKSRLFTAITSGYSVDKIVVASRTLDENLIKLNNQGYLNGHTPLSALVAFSSLLVAYLFGKEFIVLSNESSANDYTIAETEVKHQYSKSYQFEADFNEYLSSYLHFGIKYFSLLRPFCELQISDYFSKLTEFHSGFNSCNLGSKTNVWCLGCPKCLFVYIILSPFISPIKLEKIFGANLLNEKKFLEDFKKLIGQNPNKPFECVGSREEVNMAVNMAIKKLRSKNGKIPYLYQEYMKTNIFTPDSNSDTDYKKYWDAQHLIPKEFMRFAEMSGMHANDEI